MNRQTIARQLALAEEFVRLGAARVAIQREAVAEMEGESSVYARQARELLDTFVSIQETLVAERDRLLAELAEETARSGSSID